MTTGTLAWDHATGTSSCRHLDAAISTAFLHPFAIHAGPILNFSERSRHPPHVNGSPACEQWISCTLTYEEFLDISPNIRHLSRSFRSLILVTCTVVKCLHATASGHAAFSIILRILLVLSPAVRHVYPPAWPVALIHGPPGKRLARPVQDLHTHARPHLVSSPISLAAALVSKAWSLFLTLDPCATCCPLFCISELQTLVNSLFASVLEPRPPESTHSHLILAACLSPTLLPPQIRASCFWSLQTQRLWVPSPDFPCPLIHHPPKPIPSSTPIHPSIPSSSPHPLGHRQPVSI